MARTVGLEVMTVEKHRFLSAIGANGKPTAFKDGDVLVQVNVVTAKAVENQMVVVKAADMADALATKGVIDLYGVYFDTDKTEVKAESSGTLDEVASL